MSTYHRSCCWSEKNRDEKKMEVRQMSSVKKQITVALVRAVPQAIKPKQSFSRTPRRLRKMSRMANANERHAGILFDGLCCEAAWDVAGAQGKMTIRLSRVLFTNDVPGSRIRTGTESPAGRAGWIAM